MNQNLLHQERQGLKQIIEADLAVFIIFRKSKTDNGNGVLVEDPFGTSTPIQFRGRISKTKTDPTAPQPADTGFQHVPGYYLTTDFQHEIMENDRFSFSGNNYRVGPVVELKKFNGLIGYQAVLFSNEDAPAEES